MNKVMLIGNLTKDPDVRTTSGGTSVTTLSIAVNRRFKDKSGERVTDYFRVVTWNKLADICGKYLVKGSKVSVSGELQTKDYEAKDGTKRYVTEILADEVEFLTPKSDRNQNADDIGFTDITGDEGEGFPF